jgi:hypothetical protein
MRFQHGDVILVSIEKISDGAKQIKINAGFVVEKGEGIHTHVLKTVEGVSVFENTKKEIEMLVTTPTEIDHEEHGSKLIPPGIWKKEIENEYDAELDESFKTKD